MSDAQLEILASRAGLAVDWIDASGQKGIPLQVDHLAAIRLAHPYIPDQHPCPIP